ncbi:Uncharacterised protein [Dorea longicatena]|nr:Uncharacterised protein [Dorea longicatena]
MLPFRWIFYAFALYMNKLDIAKRTFYENLLHEIDELFDKSIFTDNSRLEGLYLLGFHNQAYDLKLKKEKSEEESSEE